jgi:hypothetical protein
MLSNMLGIPKKRIFDPQKGYLVRLIAQKEEVKRVFAESIEVKRYI